VPNKTRHIVTLFLLFQASSVAAEAYRTGNPGSAYPPACISGPLNQLDLTGDNAAMFFSDRIWLEVTHKIESSDPEANLGEVQLDMYRLACSEPDRSVIIAEFTLPPEWVDPRKSALLLPWVGGNGPFDLWPLVWHAEANAWGNYAQQTYYTSLAIGDYTGGWDDARRFGWRFVLDIPPPGGFGGRASAPHYYNSNFSILLFRGDGEYFFGINVPATSTLFSDPAPLALGGRLSGNWVEEGSADQGLLISFSAGPPPPGGTAEPERSPLVAFLSWFTFDGDGDLLWLTGAASFAQGSSEMLVPLEAVEQGQFIGDVTAERTAVGTARLRAIHCNWIEVEYDLSPLGLGQDVMRLERLYALELADYPCRDYEGLQTSIYPPESQDRVTVETR